MNSKKIKVIITVVLIVGLCFLTACGGKGSSSAIVGTWISTEAEEIKIIFNSDGTWQYVAAADAHGTWKITEGKDNEIQMPSETGLGQDMLHVGGVHQFSIDGNILTIEGVGEFEKE